MPPGGGAQKFAHSQLQRNQGLACIHQPVLGKLVLPRTAAIFHIIYYDVTILHIICYDVTEAHLLTDNWPHAVLDPLSFGSSVSCPVCAYLCRCVRESEKCLWVCVFAGDTRVCGRMRVNRCLSQRSASPPPSHERGVAVPFPLWVYY